MKYINTKTRAVIETDSRLSGGDWKLVTDLEVETPQDDVQLPPPDAEKVEEPDETVELPEDIDNYTIADLRELAVDLQVDLTGKTKKEEILAAIKGE